MPKFKVSCYREVLDVLRQDVEVEADNETAAIEAALKVAQENGDDWDFWQCGDTGVPDWADEARQIEPNT